MGEQVYIESDANDQLTGSVKLRSLLLKSIRSDACQSRTLRKHADKEPLQQFDVAVGCDVGEYVTSPPSSNASSVTLFLPASQGTETTRIYYVGFLGQWSERKQEPVITVYESQANIADHEEIQSVEGNFSLPSH
ncbi:hypothetical protein EDB85DRAFT_2040054 [Lactarius pseudohatsudake]|nr:hypothetical protein EDB85DRAFT_2040054 [Lactarius pseudohatsudake]